MWGKCDKIGRWAEKAATFFLPQQKNVNPRRTSADKRQDNAANFESIFLLQLQRMGTKRERDHQGATGKSKKRQKVEKPANGADADTDRLLGVDELDWKEVQLPDRLDDAGGFFGLEEIEGVDIVRPQGGGEVKFKVGLQC